MTADLDGLPFHVVRRGYDRAQVEERLGRLLSERDDAQAARQDALAKLERVQRELEVSRNETRGARAELAEARADVDRLSGQVAELATIPSTVGGMSDRLQQMVRVAQDEVNDMRTRATRSAAQVLSMAQAEADELREAAHQERRTFEAEQRRAEEEVAGRLEESRAQLQELREEADGRRARLDAELAERRAQDEQVLTSEIAERREAMLADLAAQEKRQRDEAQRIVDAASSRARTMVADAVSEADRERSQTREQVTRAGDELEQLRALQHQVAEQLSGVRSLLDWTLPRINTSAGESPVGEGRSVAATSPLAVTMPSPPVSMAPESRRYALATVDRAAEDIDPPAFPAAGADGASVDVSGLGTFDGADARPSDPEPVTTGDDAADAEPVGAGRSVPQPRGTEPGETSRPSPTARSGHRAGSRR